MNKLALYIIAASAFLSFSSCSNDDDELEVIQEKIGPEFRERLITGYVTPSQLKAGVPPSYDWVAVEVAGNGWCTMGKEYDYLSSKYNDTSFNQVTSCEPEIAVNDSLKAIKVVTLNDFDDKHPSGSDVSEMVDCAWASYNSFIQNGYKHTEGYAAPEGANGTNGIFYNPEYLEVTYAPVSHVNKTNTVLTDRTFYLCFKQQPTTAGEHKYRVVFSYTNGDIATEFTR